MAIRNHAPLRRASTGVRKASLIGSCVALACVGLPAGAFGADPVPAAQDQGGAKELPKVKVEGTRPDANPYADPAAPLKVDRSANGKFTEKLRDTPKTITVLPKELLQDLGAKSFRDVVRTQPGVTLGTGEGGNAFGDRIFIRGFEARNDIFIDGMRDPGVLSREIFDTEQIEIVKGPGSAFAGRGSTGGAVNMISKAPAPTTFYSAEATFGNADTKRITLDLNQVINDKLSVRVNGLWHDGGVPGRNFVEQERTGVAFAGLLKLTDDLRLTVDYYHFDMNGLPDYGMPFDTRTKKPFQGVPRDTYYGILDRDFLKGRSEIVTAGVEWEPTAVVDVRSRFRWGKTSNRYVVSAPESPPSLTAGANSWLNAPSTWRVSPNAKNRNSENSLLANQTDATWRFETGSLSHTFVGGLEFSQETIFNRPYVSNNQSLSTELGPGVPPIAGTVSFSLLYPDNDVNVLADPFPGANWTEVTIGTAALYLIDTIEITPQWHLTGGLRYDYYDVQSRAYNATTRLETALEDHSNLINWHAGLTYKPVEAGTLYFAAGTSSNPAGEQVDGIADAVYGGLTAATAVLDPEKTTAYELGVKWELFDGHLLATSAIFQTEKDNARVSSPIAGVPVATAGKIRVQGIELGLAGRITPRWEVSGGLTLLETKVVRSPFPAEVGRALANIPETTFSLLTNYLVTPALKVGAQVHFASKIWGSGGGTANAGLGSGGVNYAPEYVRLDANASYDLSDNVKLRLNVNNITDVVYYDAIYRSATPFAYIAPGRTVLGSVTVTF